jgi:outer membrane immunogenic protein
MKKILFGVVAILALIVTPALAADMPVKAPAPVVSPEYNWSGFYVGASAGWVRSSYNWAYSNPAPAACCAPFSASVTDTLIGGHAGAQWQWSHVVIGVEGGADGFLNGSRASQGLCVNTVPAGVCFIQPKDIETLGGRLGWAWQNWLLYGDGGGTRSTVGSQFINGGVADNTNGPTYKNGWYAGGGVEYVLVKGGIFDLIGGVEYQHMNLGTQANLDSADGFAPSPPGVNGRNIGAKEDLVRVRLSVKLNPWATP